LTLCERVELPQWLSLAPRAIGDDAEAAAYLLSPPLLGKELASTIRSNLIVQWVQRGSLIPTPGGDISPDVDAQLARAILRGSWLRHLATRLKPLETE
jgi:hypothetical protein